MNQHRTFAGSPFLLGVEHLERLLERSQKAASEGYPPYNIEQTAGGLVLTIAVAGFVQGELAVTVEDKQLVIRGKQNEGEGRNFLHRGIAARQFLRSFVLADGIEVTAAALENGLLKIHLARKQVQPSVRVVDIKIGDMP